MQFDLTIGGRSRRVDVTRDGSLLEVSVDGRTLRVDAARVNEQTWSLILDGGRSREVTVTEAGPGGDVMVGVGRVAVEVGVNGRTRFGRRGDAAHAAAGPQRVTAPMPGKVVRVLAVPGDQIAARQPLVVVEAMKMENELRAGRDGTVSAVHVRQGQSVDAGTLLMVIE